MHVLGTCTSMIGRQAAADPPVMYDTILCDTSVKISGYVCLACFLHVVVVVSHAATFFWWGLLGAATKSQ